MDFDNVKKAADLGAKMEVKDPTTDQPMLKDDGETPITITLAGVESDKWKKARSTVGNKYLKTAGPNRPPGAKTIEESIADDAFQLAAVTLAWDGVIVEGQELECNQANAARIYAKYDWLRNQVSEFVGNRANFCAAS